MDRRYHLENLRLLVQRTNNVEKEFCYYVKEGKLSAVTDLLLVAPEKFLPSSVNNQEFDSDRSINVREFVLDEVASMTILNMINTHVEATLEPVMKLQVKKLEMEAMLQLIEVFERMGETLAAYLRMQQLNFRKFTIDYLRMRALTRKRKYYLGSTGQIPGVSYLQSCHLIMSGCSSPRKGGTNMMRQLMEVEYAVPMNLEAWALLNGLTNEKTVNVLARRDHFSAVSSSQSSNSESLRSANRHLQSAVQMNGNVVRLQTRIFCTSIMGAVRCGIRHL